MSLIGLKTRTKTVNALRNALSKRGYQEVIPQLLSEAIPEEPTIYPFITIDKKFLATSPESYLKQAMAIGMGNCFAISNVFRNQEGKNALHNPEFLMAEWYEQDADHLKIMETVEEIVGGILNLKLGWPRLSWLKLWPELPELINDEAMKNFAKSKKYSTENATWEQLFYQIADNEIYPKFSNKPFFLTDFPTKISRLAKPQQDNPDFCDRFELLINKIELADGNTEYFDADALKWIGDEKFLAAIKKLENQTWAGVGLGVDRLAMLVGKISSIHELLEP